MLRRCEDPDNKAWRNYGGRGIKVCARWHSFEAFLQDMGERPIGLTLERKDNNGNYELRNCLWATRKEQSNNNRRNRLLTFGGETHTLAQWVALSSLSRHTIEGRLRDGVPIEEVLTRKQRHVTRIGRLTFQGKSLSVQEWAQRIGLTSAALYARLRHGWTVKDAIAVPRKGGM